MGVKAARGEYICFLDSDQWTLSGLWMENSLHILEKETGIGAVGWACGWFLPDSVAGPINDMLKLRGIPDQNIAYRRDAGYLGTAGMLMKKALFEEIGGFDDAYDPTCFEDTDLSLKIRHARYELACCPNMPIMHLPHQTTHIESASYKKLFKRNMEYFAEKWRRIHPELLAYCLDDDTC